MAVTLYVRSGDKYISVATTFPNQDGNGRALGTGMHTGGPGPRFVEMGKPWSGLTAIFGEHYRAAYEPIKDASGAIIGAYLVGEAMMSGDPNDL